MSYLSKIVGQKEIEVEHEIEDIRGLLDYLGDTYPKIADILNDDTPDVTIIMNGKTLQVPKDLENEISGEVILSPVIAGG